MKVSHSDNKVKWCLKKAEEELKEDEKHRGLVKKDPDVELAKQHIAKAEHNLKAIVAFKEHGFSDWSTSATFYSIYHGLLAVLAKLGYESRNQGCTFALIYSLIENKKINLDKKFVEEIHVLDHEEKHENPTVIEVREIEQYGVSISLEDPVYERLFSLAKNALDQIKNIIEE
ncbi:MAG: HEPN domain-containing protein [Nanoarchaeota archaeon]|nr:HEPN domain-containing protein [Nanoarchaeota archaeon]